MKLDSGYSHYPSFIGNYDTGDLIRCFENILAQEKMINLQGLSNMLDKDNLARLNPATYAIQEFLNMFAIIQIRSLTQREHSCIERNASLSSYCNQNMIKANGELIEIEGMKNGMLNSTVQPKIRVKTPKSQYHQVG